MQAEEEEAVMESPEEEEEEEEKEEVSMTKCSSCRVAQNAFTAEGRQLPRMIIYFSRCVVNRCDCQPPDFSRFQ
jgi:hypothetical protein